MLCEQTGISQNLSKVSAFLSFFLLLFLFLFIVVVVVRRFAFFSRSVHFIVIIYRALVRSMRLSRPSTHNTQRRLRLRNFMLWDVFICVLICYGRFYEATFFLLCACIACVYFCVSDKMLRSNIACKCYLRFIYIYHITIMAINF